MAEDVAEAMAATDAVEGGGACEIGSLEMPPAEWLFSAAAAFQQSYGQIHPYLAAGLCIAGTLMNLVTVLVLTRPTMRSPVNVLLCAVACCDIVVEWSYLVFVLHFLLASAQRCEPTDFSWAWALFMMFHAHASVIFHAASIWMTVSLAQIRVLTIRRATTGPTTPLITERFTAILAVLTTLVMVLVNVPNFLTFEIMEVPASAMLPCWQPTGTTAAAAEGMMPIPTTTMASLAIEIVPSTTLAPTTFVPTTEMPTMPMEMLSNGTSPPSMGSTITPNAVDADLAKVEQEIAELIANLTGPLMSTIAPMLIGGTSRIRRQHRLKRFRRDIDIPAAVPSADIQNPPQEYQQQFWSAGMETEMEEPMVYTVRAHDSDCMKLKMAFWSNGMIFKVIPCLLLTFSIVALLRIIADVAHKRKNLAQVMRKKVPKDHTTPMLAAILLIFLLAELPQGLFLVLNGIFSSESFHKRVYLPLGDLMDLLSLLNSAVGFLIYVGMSRKFRTVLLQLLFSAIGCLLSKTPCAPWGIPPPGESTDGDMRSKSWRRTSASQTQQQLFHSGGLHKHSEQPSTNGASTTVATKLLANKSERGGGRSGWKKCRNGGAIGKKRRKGGGGGGEEFKDGWMRWRKFSRNTKSTELTVSRTEQLSLCPSSLLGLPPLTLAVSCSAGITAAAASVGVHLLHLDPPSSPPATTSPPPQHADGHSPDAMLATSASSAYLLISPPPLPNTIFRRPSSESQLSGCSSITGCGTNSLHHHHQYLDIPGRPASSSILLMPNGNDASASSSSSTKRASFLSLREEQRLPLEANGARPLKRISFNLPPMHDGANKEEEDHHQLQHGRSRTLTNGVVKQRNSPRNVGGGIGQRLRRSFLLSLGTNNRRLVGEFVSSSSNSRADAESGMVEKEEENAEDDDAKEEEHDGKRKEEDAEMEAAVQQNGHCSSGNDPASPIDDDADGIVDAATAVADCPGKALLKLQRQQHSPHHHGRRSRKLSSALARALFSKLTAVALGKSNGAEDQPEKFDSTGSSSPQRKICTLRAETHFNGWAAYC